MDEMRKEQLEALQTAADYIMKLVPAFKELVEELSTDKKEDTIDFLNQAIEGLNFIIEIFNATLPMLNEKEELFQKDVIEEKIQAMNHAIEARDDVATATAIEDGIIPFLEIFAQISKIFLAGQEAE
jgi:hypothetical protein